MKSETTPAHSWQFEALGTSWEILTRQKLTLELRALIEETIAEFNGVYSRFREDSLVQKAAKKSGVYEFPESIEPILSLYEDLYTLTGGKVTPLVGDVLESAGYDANYSLKPKETIRYVKRYSDVIRRSGRKVAVLEPVLIDIGAVGKGYLVEKLSKLLSGNGYKDSVIDGGGDMRVRGDFTERVGLEHPQNTEDVIGVVLLHDKALCASASNRRAWGEWHHVIDPDTSTPTRDIVATWVVADDALIADGLATALFFVDPQILATKYTYEYIRMYAGGGIEYSDYFAKGVFS